MDKTTKPLEEVVKELPPHLQSEVSDFIEFLLNKYRKERTGGKMKQNWAGALRNFKHQYTSIELQHRASEWRND